MEEGRAHQGLTSGADTTCHNIARGNLGYCHVKGSAESARWEGGECAYSLSASEFPPFVKVQACSFFCWIGDCLGVLVLPHDGIDIERCAASLEELEAEEADRWAREEEAMLEELDRELELERRLLAVRSPWAKVARMAGATEARAEAAAESAAYFFGTSDLGFANVCDGKAEAYDAVVADLRALARELAAAAAGEVA